MSFWMVGTTVVMAGVSAYSANQSAKAQNRQADAMADNANRRYALEAGVASQQMDEQGSIAFESMTDVTRQFLVARGQARAIQAESGVSGKTQQRMESVDRTKASEVKSKVARDVNTNIVNIAQGMLASKVDTEALVAEANARRKNVGMDTLMGGIQGGISGYQIGSSFKAPSQTRGTVASTPQMSTQPSFADTYINRQSTQNPF